MTAAGALPRKGFEVMSVAVACNGKRLCAKFLFNFLFSLKGLEKGAGKTFP